MKQHSQKSKPQTMPGEEGANSKQTLLFAGWIFFIALLAYSQFFGVRIMEFDAVSKIISHSGKDAAEIFRIFSSPEEHYLFFSSNYRPFESLVLWIAYLFNGLDFFMLHFLGFFLHAVNSVLVFFLARRLLKDNFGFFSFLAAALFALHPVNINTVLFVSRLHEPLVAFGLLASLLCLARFLETGKKLFFAFAFLFCAIGTFSKETGLLIAPMLFLYCLAFLKQKNILGRLFEAARLCIPFFFLAAAYVTLTFLALGRFGGYATASPSLRSQLVVSFFRYILYPNDFLQNNFFLSARTFFGQQLPNIVFLAVFSALVLVILWLFSRQKEKRQALFLLAWLFGFLFAFVVFGFMYPWYTYIPLIAFAILFGFFLKKCNAFFHKSRLSLLCALLVIVFFASPLAFSPLFVSYKQPLIASQLSQKIFSQTLSAVSRLPDESTVFLVNYPRYFSFNENGFSHTIFLVHGGSIQAMLDYAMPKKKASIIALTNSSITEASLAKNQFGFFVRGNCSFVLENALPKLAHIRRDAMARRIPDIGFAGNFSQTEIIEMQFPEKECKTAIFLFFDGQNIQLLKATGNLPAKAQVN